MDAGSSDVDGWVSGDELACGEEAEEDADGDGFELDGSGGEAGVFAVGEVIGDVGVGDFGRGGGWVEIGEPREEGFEGAAAGELVIDGEAALDVEVEEEVVDEGEGFVWEEGCWHGGGVGKDCSAIEGIGIRLGLM